MGLNRRNAIADHGKVRCASGRSLEGTNGEPAVAGLPRRTVGLWPRHPDAAGGRPSTTVRPPAPTRISARNTAMIESVSSLLPIKRP